MSCRFFLCVCLLCLCQEATIEIKTVAVHEKPRFHTLFYVFRCQPFPQIYDSYFSNLWVAVHTYNLSPLTIIIGHG